MYGRLYLVIVPDYANAKTGNYRGDDGREEGGSASNVLIFFFTPLE